MRACASHLMTGQYEPGSRLNIRRLAATYNTSPTPVREAIVQLVREGALELRLGHQPRVPVLTIPQYINIRETRAPLERLAAELGAVHITRRRDRNPEGTARQVRAVRKGRALEGGSGRQPGVSFHHLSCVRQ